MAESHVVSSLISKRAELLGQISVHKKEIQRISAALSHIDHTIKLFSPEFDLRTVKAKRTNQRNPYFAKGELQSLLLDCLRDFNQPLSCKEISSRIIDTKHLVDIQAKDIESNVVVILRRLRDKGVVSSIDASTRPYLWQLV